MAIKTSKDNHAVVKRLQLLYGFAQMHLPAKIAVALSLQQNKIFDLQDFQNVDNNGVEFSEDTLFGGRDNYIVYKALFNQHYERLLGDSEFNKLVKIHLDWGLNKLKEEVLDSDRGRNAHVDYLLSIIKRGTNLVINEQSLPLNQGAINYLTPPFTIPDLVSFELGKKQNGEVVEIKLNDLKEYESHHIAIAGTTGSGKTELIKDILHQISKNTNGKLKFIFFDYKGEGESNKLKPFLDSTNCQYINPLEQDFDFNPLSFINITNERYLNFHINSFVDAVAAIETKLGAKQKNLLKTILSLCFEKKKKKGEHPTLLDLFEEVKSYYEEHKEKPDSLFAIMDDLSQGVFANKQISKQNKIYEKNIYVSLPEAMSEKLRQLCVFLTLKYLLSEFTAMDDTIPNDDRINPLRYVIVIDEAHVYLNNKNARSILEQLLRVIRSKGVVVIMLSQSPEDYYKPDFDFASQVKIPICLHIKNKNEKAIERFIGGAKSSHKLNSAVDKLNSGFGLINLSEPQIIEIRQFWKEIK